MSSKKWSMEPIGYVESCFKERFGTPRQSGLVDSSWGILRLRKELNLTDALTDLEGFSHIWLIFVFHENRNRGFNAKVRPPRLLAGGGDLAVWVGARPAFTSALNFFSLMRSSLLCSSKIG